MALSDITQSCSNNFRAGIQEFYMIAACSLTAGTAGATDHEWTALTSSEDWVKIEGDNNTMDFTVTGGSKGSFTVAANIMFEGYQKVNLAKVQAIIDTRKVAIVAVTNNSAGTNPQAVLLGFDNIRGNASYLVPTGSGVIEADIVEGANNISIAFEGIALEYPREINGTIAYNAGTVTFGS